MRFFFSFIVFFIIIILFFILFYFYFIFQGEEWVQCTLCNELARAECMDLGKSLVYICHNCDSDTDYIYIC